MSSGADTWLDWWPEPPENYPALHSIDGGAPIGCKVIGYRVIVWNVRPLLQNGVPRHPGDPGFHEAIMAAAAGDPLPPGWTRPCVRVKQLVARVQGNPVLLEGEARNYGYPHAMAVGPDLIALCEIADQ